MGVLLSQVPRDMTDIHRQHAMHNIQGNKGNKGAKPGAQRIQHSYGSWRPQGILGNRPTQDTRQCTKVTHQGSKGTQKATRGTKDTRGTEASKGTRGTKSTTGIKDLCLSRRSQLNLCTPTVHAWPMDQAHHKILGDIYLIMGADQIETEKLVTTLEGHANTTSRASAKFDLSRAAAVLTAAAPAIQAIAQNLHWRPSAKCN